MYGQFRCFVTLSYPVPVLDRAVIEKLFGLKRRQATLPPDVDLQPGQLRVEFDGVEDLLSKLFELAHSAANDFVRFRNAVESAQNSQKV